MNVFVVPARVKYTAAPSPENNAISETVLLFAAISSFSSNGVDQPVPNIPPRVPYILLSAIVFLVEI